MNRGPSIKSWNIFYFQLTIILGHIEHKHTSCTPYPVFFSLRKTKQHRGVTSTH